MKNEDTHDADIQPDAEFDKDEEIQYSEDTEGGTAAIKKLKDKLKVCIAERGEYLDGWQRANADLVNARKNFDTERSKIQSYASETAILEIIPVVDNFEMAFANKQSWESVDKNWRTGVEYIYNQLLKVLQNHDVIQLNPVDEIFDPAFHTAIETISTDDEEKDQHVIEVVMRGYKMHDKIIRPAQVKTAHYEKSN